MDHDPLLYPAADPRPVPFAGPRAREPRRGVAHACGAGNPRRRSGAIALATRLCASATLALLALALAAPPAAAQPRRLGEGRGGVTLFRDLNLTGVNQSFTGDVPDLAQTRFGNDHATSVRVDPGCRARLYRDAGFRGRFLEVTGEVRDLRGSPVGDDQTSSVQVRCGDDPWDDGGGDDRWLDRGLTLYRDLRFAGASESFDRDLPDLRGSRIGDDQATSARVSPGCRARLYQHPDYRGPFAEVTGDEPDLRRSRVGDDQVSSIQVRCGRDPDNWAAYGVTLYRDLRFTGVNESFDRDVPDLRATLVGDDRASSARVSRGCAARLYQHPDYGGDFTEVTGDLPDLRGSRVGDDGASSVRVRCEGGGWGGGDGGGGGRGVTLFRDPRFAGVQESFGRDVSDLRGSRIGDDQATSVRVDRGCRVRLYADPGFAGAYVELLGDDPDLRGSRVGDDSVSSLQVWCDR